MLGRAILELLAREPLSGYDLKKRFASSLAFGWHAYDSQIYPELKRLERAELVSWTTEESSAGPPRRVYRLTAHGLEALIAWLSSPLEDVRQKSELVLRVWAADLIPPARLESLLSTVGESTREALSRMEHIRGSLLERYGQPELAADESQVGPLLCVEHDILALRARLEWVQQALRVLTVRRAIHSRTAKGKPSPKRPAGSSNVVSSLG
jgi:DNA-binding PadR family transcriptional regulator